MLCSQLQFNSWSFVLLFSFYSTIFRINHPSVILKWEEKIILSSTTNCFYLESSKIELTLLSILSWLVHQIHCDIAVKIELTDSKRLEHNQTEYWTIIMILNQEELKYGTNYNIDMLIVTLLGHEYITVDEKRLDLLNIISLVKKIL